MGNKRRAINKRVINKKKNNNVKKMKIAFSSKVLSMGPGKKMLNIDRELIGENGNILINLGSIIYGDEFGTTSVNFNLVKVRSIQLVGYPNDEMNNHPTYINLDYFGEIDSQNIGQNERTKIIYNDTKRPVYFNFRLPPIYIEGKKINGWVKTEEITSLLNNIELKVITPNENREVRVRCVIRCEFRMPRISSQNGRISLRTTESDFKRKDNYERRFSDKQIKEIKPIIKKNKVKYPKDEIEKKELEELETRDVAAESILEENKNELSGSTINKENEVIVNNQGKNKKKNRKKKENKKNKKAENNDPGVKRENTFQSLFKKEREMVKMEQLKEDTIEEEPSNKKSKDLHILFYDNYYKIRNSKTPYKSYLDFEKNIDDWKEYDEEVGELLFGYEPEDYDDDTTRRFICGFLKELALKRGYNDIY